jgi:hypothetical protein
MQMYFLFESSAADDDDENNDDHDDGTQSTSCFIQHMPIFSVFLRWQYDNNNMVIRPSLAE